MTRLLVVSVLAAALMVPLVLVADGNYYVLLVGLALILAGMAALDADRFLRGKRHHTRLH
jgi:hypothetical protein